MEHQVSHGELVKEDVGRHAPTVPYNAGFGIQNFDIGIFGIDDMRTLFNDIHANFFPFHQNVPVECGLDRLF